MKILIQRVKHSKCTVDGKEISKIGQGILVFVGITNDDTTEDIEWLANKMVNLRIFNDEDGVMNKSCIEIDGEIMIISQFTLHARTKKGNRPSYVDAAKPEISEPLYKKFIETVNSLTGKTSATGIFGADMKIELLNDGPVTIIIDSKNRI
ncbi:MAG: D-tyrosyl-tRNA(Tyr) deacylase [Bacteroidales bacterium]|nr:D-tyrosyl-tRNA(Tyr) deacylase [Bacteroidales bacterium]